jgi:hypothetical protein
LREAVRLGNFSVGLAVDVVINPKRSALTADFGDLQGEIAKAFQVIEKHLQKGNPQLSVIVYEHFSSRRFRFAGRAKEPVAVAVARI